MGRPWWYDSYWEKGKRPARRRFRLPRRRSWVWILLIVLSLFLTTGGTRFHPALIPWIVGFVSYICRILAFAVLLQAILSWFMTGSYNLFLAMLGDLTEPILQPIRRVVPLLGTIDITPLIVIAILYLIPAIFTRLLALLLYAMALKSA
ncbi:MAG: YggT family protein [Dehalococcoidales bacterium]|nr:YggT family protein [Dehalococcoidales bacterium]